MAGRTNDEEFVSVVREIFSEKVPGSVFSFATRGSSLSPFLKPPSAGL